MTKTTADLWFLFSEDHSGHITHKGFCGWSEGEQGAREWVREMNQCFPENRHWFRPREAGRDLVELLKHQ